MTGDLMLTPAGPVPGGDGCEFEIVASGGASASIVIPADGGGCYTCGVRGVPGVEASGGQRVCARCRRVLEVPAVRVGSRWGK